MVKRRNGIGMGKNHRINCHNCQHYFVTWVPAQPHGCRTMGFRSYHLPSAVVYQNSGCDCNAFEPKKRNPPTKIDRKKPNGR